MLAKRYSSGGQAPGAIDDGGWLAAAYGSADVLVVTAAIDFLLEPHGEPHSMDGMV
jgi:hypothetical protein